MKLVIIALLVAFSWNHYQKNLSSATVQTEQETYENPITSISQPTESFSCDGRQHCSQMRSRAEAEFFLKSCPNTKMDGDHDGVPCENDSRF